MKTLITNIFKSTLSVSAAVLLSFCMISFSSCSSSEDNDGGGGSGQFSLSVSGDVSIDPHGGLRTIVVNGNKAWTAVISENTDSWLTYKKISDNAFTLTASENPLLTERKAKVTVSLSDGTDSKELTIVQAVKPQFITLSKTSLADVAVAGETHTIDVSWTDRVSVSYRLQRNEGWIDIPQELTDGKLTITIHPNSSSARTDNIIFSDDNEFAEDVILTISQLGVGDMDINDPTTYGYTLKSAMQADVSLVGQTWNTVHTYMRTYGWDYSEHPNNATGDHSGEQHIEVLWDDELNQYVYNFLSHCNENALDGERGPSAGSDRMRNEMKSQTSSSWYHLNGNYDEWQVLEWKMKIPVGFRPSSSFTHIHQLKGQEGTNIGSPVITISLRGSNDGTGRRIEVIHTGRAGSTSQGKIVDNTTEYSLDKFEGEWLQVQQETNYKRHGYYRIRITRIRDNAVLMDYTNNDIDIWRDGGCINVRNKFGIYRSYGSTMGTAEDRPTNGIKDENLWLADFKVYEKNTNSNPEAVND